MVEPDEEANRLAETYEVKLAIFTEIVLQAIRAANPDATAAIVDVHG